jgi:hypothetical protein
MGGGGIEVGSTEMRGRNVAWVFHESGMRKLKIQTHLSLFIKLHCPSEAFKTPLLI